MTEQTQDQRPDNNKKMSDEMFGMILLFAAIPLIAYIKWNYDDHVALGAIASIIMGGSAIFLRKKFG